MSRIDRAFHRYARIRDPRALAYVFDHAAPELLALARCLAGATAEDVLQDTFLVAIERAGSFTEGARVLPWLCGILVHKAKESRRQPRPQPGPELDEEATGSDPAPGPEAEAARMEMRARVHDALARLPARYRAVMAPIVHEGLAPDEVARRLARNPSTVRTQVARGLEHLRRALPVGGAVVLVGRTQAAAQIARVRRTVLQHGGGEVAAAGGTGLLIAAALLVTALGVGAALLARDHTRAGDEPVAPVAAGASGRPDVLAGAAETAAPHAVVAGLANGAHAALAAGHGGSTSPSSTLVEVRGRCVDAESGAPLADCEVAVQGSMRNADTRLYWGEAAWQDPEPVHTGADGSFLLRVEPWPAMSYTVSTRAPGRPPSRTWFEGAAATDGLDLGPVRLERGHAVSGRAVDEDGSGVARMSLTLRWKGRSSVGLEEGGAAYFETDADGRWQPRSDTGRSHGPLVPARTYRYTWGVGLPGDEYTLGPNEVLPLALPEAGLAADGTVRLDLVVRPPLAIAGRIVDERDAPVGEALVSARLPAPDPRLPARPGHDWIAMVRASAEGAFSLLARADRQGTARLVVEGDFDTLAPEQPVAWGARDVVVRVRPRTPPPSEARPVLDVAVVDAVTGAPVERFGLRLWLPFQGNDRRGGGSKLSHAGEHAGGRVQVDDFEPGRHGLEVFPGRGHDRTFQDVEVPREGTATVQIAVAPVAFPHLEVRVQRADGTVVPGADVEVVEVLTGRTITERSFVLPAFGWSSNYDGIERGRGRTDASGACEVEVSRRSGVDTFALRVRAPDLPAAVLNGVPLLGDTGSALVTMPEPATLRVRLEPPSLTLLAPRLRLLRERRFVPTSPPSDGSGLPFSSDGTLVVRGLPPGEMQPELVAVVVAGLPIPHRLELLPPVQLEAGRTTELVARAPRLTPGRLHGRVIRAGEPRWTQATELLLDGRFEGENPPPIPSLVNPKHGPFRTEPDGTFEVVLPPGRYRLVAASAPAGQEPLRSVEEALVTPEGTVEQTFVMR